jgi:hypothetical protein
MAIRFQCPACTEPIEIDDHWARQVVRCPYCQRTVTAPAESTLPESDRIPIGKALRRTIGEGFDDEPRAAGIAIPIPPVYAAVPTNRVATAAFILACTMIGLLGMAALVMSRHALEVQEMQEQMEKARAAGTSGMTAMMQYLQKQGGAAPGWLITVGLIEMGVMAAWTATVILGVIGVLRPYRRAFAVAALVISGFVCFLLCFGALTSFM